MADTKQQILDFLKTNALAVAATVSPKNEPQAATVIYMADDDFNFYFVTRRHTRKVENLESNKNVALVVGTQAAPITIQANGEAELLNEKNELGQFIQKLSEKKNLEEMYYGPFLNLPGLDFVVFKVKPKWMRALYLNTETQKEEFYQLV